MSICRITLFEYNSEEDADELVAHYRENASSNFPDAEILICTRTGPTTAVMNSVCPDKETADNAMAARKSAIKGHGEKIKNFETHQGEVTLALVR